MFPAQHALDVHHAGFQRVAVRHLGGEAPQPVVPENAEFRGSEGYEHVVVRVGPETSAHFREHADDLEGDASDQQRAADQELGIHLQIRRHLGAEHREAALGRQVPGGEHAPVGHCQAMHFGVAFRGAVHHVVQVPVAELDLPPGAELRHHRGQHLAVPTQRFVVVHGERDAVGRGDAAKEGLPWHHRQHPGAEALDLLVDGPLGARAKSDHGDHRGDADDDAEHGEAGTQQIGDDGRQRHANGLDEGHG